MIAGYHHKLPPDWQQDMNKARQQSGAVGEHEYTQALAKGDALIPEERAEVIEDMSRFTGLSKEVIDQANLRIDVRKFTHYLLIDQKLRVGRSMDGYTGPDPNGLLDTPFYDPTEANIMAPYNASSTTTVRMSWDTRRICRITFLPTKKGSRISGIGVRGEGFPDTASALRRALVKNPFLKGAGDGGLRPGVSLLRGQLQHGTPGLAGEIPQPDILCDLRVRAHGLFTDGELKEDEDTTNLASSIKPCQQSSKLDCGGTGILARALIETQAPLLPRA